MKPFLKWLTITLSALLLIVVSSLGLLLFTTWGVDFVLWGVQKALPTVKIDQHQGQLLDGLKFEGIDIELPGIDIKAKSLFVDISTQCLLSKTVCVKSLELDEALVQITQVETSESSTESTPITEILAPLPISIDNVSLTNVYINALGYEISSGSLMTAAKWVGDTATLKATQWHNIAINLPKAQANQQAPTLEKATNPQENIILPKVLLPLNIVVDDISIANVSLDEQPILTELRLKADAKGSEVNLSHLYVDAPQGKVTTLAKIDLQQNYPLFLEASANLAMAPLNQHQINLKAQGDLKQLAVNADLTGTLKAVIAGKLDVLNANFPFELSLESTNLQWPIDKAEYQLKDTSFMAKGSLKGYQATVAATVEGSTIPSAKFSTKIEGDLAKISLNEFKLNTLLGAISGNASADWSDDVIWSSDLRFDNIQPGSYWKEAEGNVSGSIAHKGSFSPEKGWAVDLSNLDINGIIRQQALSLKGKLNASGNADNSKFKVNTQGLALRHGKNSLSVNGQVDEKLALNLDVNILSLASSLPQMKGFAKGKINLTGSLEKPKANIDLIAKNLVLPDKILSIQTVKVNGTVTALPVVAGKLTVSATGVKADGVDIKNANLVFSGNEKDHSLTLFVKGEPVGTDIAILGSFVKNQWSGSISKTDFSTPLGQWKLAKKAPISFNLQNTALTLGDFCLQQTQSKVCIKDTKTQADSGKTSLVISHYDLRRLNKFLPKDTRLRGILDGSTKVAWRGNALPTAQMDFALTEGRVVQQISEEKPLSINIKKISLAGNVKEDKLHSQLKLDLDKNGLASFDLIMDKLTSDNRSVNSQFSLANINLAMLAPLLDQSAKLEGVLDGGFSLTGNLNAPKANGKISLSGMKLQSLSSPLIINDGTVDIKLVGQKANLLGKIVTPDGQININGDAAWPKVDAWLASLTVDSNNLKIEVPPMVDLRVSSNLTMKASPKLVEVNGEINIPWGRITVEELPPSAISISPDVVMLNEKRQPVEQRQATALPFNAKLKVSLGDDVRLDAFGLRTNLMGDLAVSSTQKGPSLLGEIALVDGLYRSFGQDLRIKNGLIRFNGPADQPYLQVVAIRNPESIEDDVEAGIRVVGTPTAPNIEIFSEPAMPQANALSYLTRGRALDSDAGGNAMTSMLISLGLSQSGMLVGRIGEAFGVKDLSVDTAGQGDDEQVVVSGYILPGLQVKYGVGIFNSLPEFTLRYNLLKNLYLEAVSGADTAIDLLYQFSID